MLISNYSLLNSHIGITLGLYNTNSVALIHVLFSLNSFCLHSILKIFPFTTSPKIKTTKINGKCSKMELRTVYILKKVTQKFFGSKNFWNFQLAHRLSFTKNVFFDKLPVPF